MKNLSGYLLLLILFLCSCSTKRDAKNPDKIIIAMSQSSDMERVLHRKDVVEKYLNKTLDLEVEVLLVGSSTAMIEAMQSDKVDVGYGGAFTYLLAESRLPLEPLVVAAHADGTVMHYYSQFIARPSLTNLNSLEDIKRESSNLKMSWGAPTSTSSHLIPKYHLEQIGVKPDDFAEIAHATDHIQSIFTIKTGKADLAACSNKSLQRMVEKQKIDSSEYQVVWRSPKIPVGPIFVRKNLDEKLKEQLQKAYLTMKNDTETWKIVLEQYQTTENIDYIVPNTSTYDYLRMINNYLKSRSLL